MLKIASIVNNEGMVRWECNYKYNLTVINNTSKDYIATYIEMHMKDY